MNDTTFRRTGGLAAIALALSSILYAVAYLFITPADQRGSDVDKFFASFASDPTGRQLANVFFVTGGIFGTFAVVALARRLRPVSQDWAAFLAITGVVANLAAMAHGFWNMSRLHELSLSYATAANQAAVDVLYHQPSPVDPLAIFRFGLPGLVGLLFGLLILQTDDLPKPLGWIGVVLGIDLMALFAVTWAGIGALVLITGGLASLILLPVFWIWTGRILFSEPASS